jgi:hypothetical protein
VAVGRSVVAERWPEMLEELLGRVAARFPRVEPRRRVQGFVLGLLADLPRKNCWTIAEHARGHQLRWHATPARSRGVGHRRCAP